MLSDEDIKKKPAKKSVTKKKSSTKTKKEQAEKKATEEKNDALQVTGKDNLEGKPCPLCGKGQIIKGRTAYGCSRWKDGCTYRLPFEQLP